jgi:C1A family cysteine protease
VRKSARRFVSGLKPEPRTPKRPKGLGGYGWVPDLPDARDYLYAAPSQTLGNLPPRVNLESQCPPVYNQGKLGSCTANAIAAAVEFIQTRRFMPSRLFIYYFERVIEGTVNSDSGGQIRDGIKAVSTVGVCPESVWPYNVDAFTNEPSDAAYDSAKKTKATVYSKVAQDLTQMKGCLAEGFPFIFGFTVYKYFDSDAVAKSGVVRLPTTHDKSAGGHAVMAVGYDDASQTFRIRNSWGVSWGKRGYFTMPYAYLMSSHLASDFWTIRNES